MRNPSHDPRVEIEAANPWYVADQFATQCGAQASRAVLENRWRVFARAIDEWVGSTGRLPAFAMDAGCGDGINLSFLTRLCAERGWPTRLVGADYSALRIGRARRFESCCLARTSLTSLGFADASFDIVLCNQVLEHIPDDDAAFREIHRVLRPSGLCVIGVPNEGSMLGTLRNHVLQRSVLRSTDHVNMYTEQILRRRMSQANLRVERVLPEGFFVPHTAVHAALNGLRPVRQVLNAIARAVPPLAAGLIVVATRRL